MSLPAPYYQDEAVTIYHGDCREIVPQLPPVDAVISDPPYGMDWDTDTTRFSGGESNRRRGDGRSDYGQIAQDNEPFDPAPWLEYPRCVLWGANHYAARLPVGTTLIWIKKDEHLWGTFLSDAEVGWMKGGHGVYAFRKPWNPPARAIDWGGDVCRPRGIHPAQKPVALMAWCIEKAKVPVGATVLDPFMGSGTTLRAAKDLGRTAIGIELDEAYCEIAAKRMSQQVLALT